MRLRVEGSRGSGLGLGGFRGLSIYLVVSGLGQFRVSHIWFLGL